MRLPSQILGLLRPKLPEVHGCDSLADSQTVDQHQRCTSGRDAVVDPGREERRSATSELTRWANLLVYTATSHRGQHTENDRRK